MKLKKVLVIAGVAVLVLGAGAGGLVVGRSQSAVSKPELAADEEIIADAAGSEDAAKEAEEGSGKGAQGEAKKAGPDSDETGDAEAEADLNYEMREITTNLNDPTGRQFVKIKLQLEASTAEHRSQIEKNQAPLRDAALFLLSGKTQAEIQSPAGQERLKRELMARFNGLLEPNAVRNIYILDFMTQRI